MPFASRSCADFTNDKHNSIITSNSSQYFIKVPVINIISQTTSISGTSLDYCQISRKFNGNKSITGAVPQPLIIPMDPDIEPDM